MMLPEPLHPALVHFPIVFTVLLPLAALAALWAIRRGSTPARAWSIPLALAAALSLSAFVSVRTGESQEERIEGVVPERALHGHEEMAELFLVLSATVLGVTALGLVGGTIGRAARLVGTAAAAALVIAGVRVGATGGDLVYVHGAASAWTQSPSVPGYEIDD